MANYIGNEPRYQNSQRDYFAGTGSQTVYTLTYTPGGANGILVAISGVIQKPSVAYYVVGKTLTFTEAPPLPNTGEVSNIEIIYLQKLGNVLAANWKTPCASNAGTTDVITASYTPQFPSLANNMLAYVVLSAANTTTTPTFSPDGLTAKIIVASDGTAIAAGALKGTVLLRYDLGTDKWWLAGSTGSAGLTGRAVLSGTTPTPDVVNNASFSWSLTGTSTLGFPGTVPTSGAWYVDITVDATGGYTLNFAAGYNKVYGYYFDCLPNAVYRLWMTARGSSVIDVNIERIV